MLTAKSTVQMALIYISHNLNFPKNNWALTKYAVSAMMMSNLSNAVNVGNFYNLPNIMIFCWLSNVLFGPSMRCKICTDGLMRNPLVQNSIFEG